MSDDKPIMLDSFPRAILHVDCDAFFTSCEQALNPQWRGKPMVTGAERNIIACASYEAKALGIKRGVALHEAKKLCPSLVILPSDYETYSLFSCRMFEAMRRFSPLVEEYSIDEGFADITGARRFFHCSYEEIAQRMKAEIQDELGITVSIGLSLSKSLAKLCSKFRKPNGFTAVKGFHIHELLRRKSLGEVWGFGSNSVALLESRGLRTALDFVKMPEAAAAKLLHKPGREIWHELRGESMWPVSTEEKTDYASVSKCKTFTAPSADRDFIFAQLVRNVEKATIKLRRHKLRARRLATALRRDDFSQAGIECDLSRATASPLELTPYVREIFDRLHKHGEVYRATMVVLSRLESDNAEQYELFQSPLRVEQLRDVTLAIDDVAARFSKHKISLGTGLFLSDHAVTSRDAQPARKTDLLPGETERCHIGLPRLNMVV